MATPPCAAGCDRRDRRANRWRALFVEEMTKAVSKPAPSAAGGCRVDAGGRTGVPATLRNFADRLDRLGPAAKVAQIGAAIGREFSYDLATVVGNS